MNKPLATRLGILLLLSWLGTAAAQTLETTAIPTVACPTNGQTVPAKPHPDRLMHAPLDQPASAPIAYYSAAEPPGVYAPKGWYCLAWSGSNGNIVLVTPQRVAPPYFPLPAIGGPAVMSQSTQGESTGRFHVAIVAAQLFSVVGSEFIKRVRGEHLISDSSFDVEHYPDDSMQYLSDRFVLYTTPADRSGLGTEGMFDMSDLPVRGLAILNTQGEVISLTEVRVRLPPGQKSVEESIMQLETGCVQRHGGC
jgi:hypothetical protein